MVSAGIHYAASQLAATRAATYQTPGASLATTTPGTVVLYQDALNARSTGWANDSQCFLRDDGLHVRNNYLCFIPAGTLTDADLSVQVKQISGSTIKPYGIVLRRASHDNYYLFAIDSNSKAAVFKCAATASACAKLMDYAPNASIRGGLNVANTLAVRARGSHFDFSVNDTIVAQIDDPTYPSGEAALAAGDNIEAVFTNLKITQAS